MKKIISLVLAITMLFFSVSSLSSCKKDKGEQVGENQNPEAENGSSVEEDGGEKGENPDKTDVMGSGACEYLDSRDLTGREVKYVEMCIEGYGRLVILLDATTAPETVANFLSLVEKGFYDGLTFHRIVAGFMIQGGDPDANGTGGHKDEDGNEINVKGEFDKNGHKNDISHKKGVISMARAADYDSASSQFFICNADASGSLDGNYAAFGYVVEGLSVIDRVTEDFFPKSEYADYYQKYEYDPYWGTYKHYVWQYLGNGRISDKADQAVIKYVKILDDWSKQN